MGVGFFSACFNGAPYLSPPVDTSLSLEESLVAHLEANEGVQGTVATHLTGLSIHPDRRPEDASMPALVYALSREPREYTLDGPGGVGEATLEIECQARDRASLRTLANAVRRSLWSFKGILGNGVTVLECSLKDERFGHANSDDGKSQPYRFVYLEFYIKYREN